MSRGFVAASSEYLFNNTAPVTAVPLTLACWINPSSLAAQGIIEINDSSNSDYFAIYITGSGDFVGVRTRAAGSSTNIASTNTISTGTWYHICGVIPAINSRSIFLDGTDKQTNSASRTPSGLNRVDIGRLHNFFFSDNDMAEAAIWNVALNDSEVAALAKGYSPLLIRPGNLVFYLPMIRDNDIDLVGGLSFTANGTPTVESHPRIIYPSTQLWVPAPEVETPKVSILSPAGVPLATRPAFVAKTQAAGASCPVVDIQDGTAQFATCATLDSVARAISWSIPTSDVEATHKFRFNETSSEATQRVFIRGSGDWDSAYTPTKAYELAIASDGGYVINRIETGGRAQIGTGAWSSDTNWWQIKFHAEGTQIRFKIWPDGDVEPTSWNEDINDSASGFTTAGQLQLALQTSSAGATHTLFIDDVSYNVPTQAVSSRLPAYIAGGLAASAGQQAYVEGVLAGTDVASRSPAYITGADTSVGNQTAYMAGADIAVDNQTAYIAGTATASDSSEAYIQGQDAASDSGEAYVAGADTASDSKEAYIAGGIDVASNAEAYVAGADTASSSISAFISGLEVTTDNKPAYIAGTDIAADSNEAYIAGGIDVANNNEAYIRGQQSSVDDKSAYIAGVDTASDNKEAYVAGVDTASDNKEAYVAGGINVADNSEAYVAGTDTASSSKSAFISSLEVTTDNKPAYIAGTDTAEDNQEAYIAGGINVVDNNEAYIQGQDAASDNNEAYIQGQDAASDNNEAYIAGIDVSSDSKSAYVSGGINVADNSEVYIKGQDTASDSKSAYISSLLTTSDSKSAYMAGTATDSDNQEAYIAGSLDVVDSKAAYIEGVAGAVDADSRQQAYIEGLTYFPFTEDFSIGGEGDPFRLSHWTGETN